MHLYYISIVQLELRLLFQSIIFMVKNELKVYYAGFPIHNPLSITTYPMQGPEGAGALPS